jgi:serine O-acetyltransferase
MFENIKADFTRHRREIDHWDLRRKFRILFQSYGFHALVVYRVQKWAEMRTVPLRYPLLIVCHVLQLLVRAAYGIDIRRTATIGPGLLIGHFGGIRVGECSLGPNCAISQRVVIDRDDRGAPVIGKSVWIGPHAKVIGPIHVGEGVAVGAGAVVVNDISPRCLALGNPARVVKNNYDNDPLLVLGWGIGDGRQPQPSCHPALH